MADVFISYAREDRPQADRIARALQAMGLECFWDTEIPPGQTWSDYIEGKLSQCKAVIVLWSAHSTGSQWVREEARMGRDKGKLIPAMLDNSPAPFGFGEVQAANLSDWHGDTAHSDWKRFAEAVRQAVARGAPAMGQTAMSAPPRAEPPRAADPVASLRKFSVSIPTWGWVAGAVVGTIVVLAGIGSMLPDDTSQMAANPAAVQQAGVAPPTTDGSPQAIILAQLQQAQAALAQEGFQIVGQPVTGGLQQGQTWNIPTEMHTGYEYRILGVCDRDCSDLDLVLYDANSAPILQDTAVSSQPVIGLTPAYTGMYTAQVQMYRCAVAPCYWAVALYGRAAR